MKAGITLITLFLFTIGVAQAQFSLEMWHDGKVVLESGDTLRGRVKYDLDNNAVRIVLPNKTEKTFTAHKAWYVEIFDENVNMYREFYALPYEIRPGYETMVYFEVLQKGEITLLSREKLVQRTVQNSPYNFYRNTYTFTDVAYQYFALKQGNELLDISTKRRDVLALLGKHEKEIKKFMKSNRLKMERRTDLIRTFAYYNALISDIEKKASRN